MRVLRIVPNLDASGLDDAALERAHTFYADVLGLGLVMDLGWIRAYAAAATMPIQLSIATEGGSGTPVPDLSIEVDDFDAAHGRTVEAGFPIEYGPVDEPWGVRRFFVRDPFGRLVNILAHASTPDGKIGEDA